MRVDQVEIVKRVLRAFSVSDLEAVLAVWGEDAEWHPAVLGGGALEGAIYRGHVGVREFLRVQHEAWASVTAEPMEIRAFGDLVLVEVRLDAVGRSSGVPVARTTWNVFEVRNGKIEAGRVFVEQDEALAVMGLR